ncbi:MAG: SDR family oxidoreductase [candidate division Zixibacteria bacterium]|nr:SDR family oxidoreductase [candidate division Zixibacteria bacterium]
MDLGIRGKVALVTAASRGLGRAVALQLAREGARVAICSRSEEAISAAGDDIAERTGADVMAFAADVTSSADIATLVESVNRSLGGIDILVTNAGGPRSGLASEFSIDDYRAATELNLMSTISLCNAVVPLMRQNRWGRIVAITSVAARQPIGNLILSNTARAGVLGFTKTLSAQVAADGITVNSVCPGYTKTERIEELAAMYAASGKGTVAEFYLNIEKDVPMKRMGTPEEFANVVAFLASERASYVTGVALQIDGGWVKSLF